MDAKMIRRADGSQIYVSLRILEDRRSLPRDTVI